MKRKEIELKIQQKETQIKFLHLQPEAQDKSNRLYNSLILEKAILKKELEESSKNMLVEKFKQIFFKKEKLICDYFK